MTAPGWRRIGKGSGPANVLGDRLRVERRRSHWIIFDLKTQRQVGNAYGQVSMKNAKAEASRIFPHLAR